jgi:hypothetical protein
MQDFLVKIKKKFQKMTRLFQKFNLCQKYCFNLMKSLWEPLVNRPNKISWSFKCSNGPSISFESKELTGVLQKFLNLTRTFTKLSPVHLPIYILSLLFLFIYFLILPFICPFIFFPFHFFLFSFFLSFHSFSHFLIFLCHSFVSF